VRSHLYYAAQLIQLLVLLAVVSTTHYFSSTWGAWLVRRRVGTAGPTLELIPDRRCTRAPSSSGKSQLTAASAQHYL
jgi:hypothetical protein